MRSNVVLVGMPGAGKSTAGVLLAKRLGLDFLDTDLAIQLREGRTLQQLVDGGGVAAFRRLEEQYFLGLVCERTVVSTGGSVIYSEPAMQSLERRGVIVFLDAPLAELEKRVTNVDTRGLVRRRDQTLPELYRERLPLYRRWAEVTVDCGTMPHAEVVEAVVAALATGRS